MKTKHIHQSERGAITVLMALAMVGLIGMAAFAVDIGYGLVTKSELQNSSDAAARAAALQLGIYYKANPSKIDDTIDVSTMRQRAVDLALANTAGQKAVGLDWNEIEPLAYNSDSKKYVASTTRVRAFRVKSRRDDQQNGAVGTTLGQILGVNDMSVLASSAAGLMALASMNPGQGDFPVGISQHWFRNGGGCKAGQNTIRFYPTGDDTGCAGWHTFTDSPPNAIKLRTILKGMEAGTFKSPQTIANATIFNFIGGTVASAFPELLSLYDSKKDAAGNFYVNVPVYQSNDCSNPNKPLLIIGFARARIYGVNTAPDKTIEADVECGIVAEGTVGSGDVDPSASGKPGDFGTLVAVPRAIEVP